MARIESLGNQADWEGQPVEDLNCVNVGRSLNAAPLREIDVDAEIMGKDLVVTPKQFRTTRNHRETLRLSEGPDAALNAQLVEEPEAMPDWRTDIQSYCDAQMDRSISQSMEEPEEYNPAALVNAGRPAGLRTVAQGDDPKKRNRGSLVWYGIAANYHSAVTGDRVLIEKDGVESEWACRGCAGKGYVEEACATCKGELSSGGAQCKDCLVLGFGTETIHSSGHKICRHCEVNKSGQIIGTGWKGRIVIQEKAQDIPMTGHVVSVGPQTLLAQLGDRVLFSKYAGHNINNEHGSFQIMRESEILMLIKEKA